MSVFDLLLKYELRERSRYATFLDLLGFFTKLWAKGGSGSETPLHLQDCLTKRLHREDNQDMLKTWFRITFLSV